MRTFVGVIILLLVIGGGLTDPEAAPLIPFLVFGAAIAVVRHMKADTDSFGSLFKGLLGWGALMTVLAAIALGGVDSPVPVSYAVGIAFGFALFGGIGLQLILTEPVERGTIISVQPPEDDPTPSE